VAWVARGEARAVLGKGVAGLMARSRRIVKNRLAAGGATYGVNTGFGHLACVEIPDSQLEALQLNLVRSHAAGVGPAADAETVRALLLLRANVLARGHSGCRVDLVRALLALLDHDVLPVVPEQGSVGASGDLAPLAHVALTLIGEGRATHGGRETSSARALSRAGLKPLRLEPKEGLALINGTQFGAAIGCLAFERARNLLRTVDVAAALSIDGLRGTWRAFDHRIHEARPHAGQLDSSGNLHRLLQNSEVWASHEKCATVQDAYSLRCAPQVHGAARDALAQLQRVLEIEINSSTDNPMVFPDAGEIISGGNFHGAPIAAVLDYASLALASLAGIIERRTDRLVNPLVSGLPPFLAREPGLESGMMMAQVTAAALASECKTLAHPGSVDSIPTSAYQEDHVSMAPWCARKLRMIVVRLETLVAIELLAGVCALRHLRPLRSSPALEAVVDGIESSVQIPRRDFPPGAVIERIRELVHSGAPVGWAETAGVLIL
jgi:histidine ammonia-lyase